ncbi:MAG: TspO/MBR family protein [Myxococcota bacterium]
MPRNVPRTRPSSSVREWYPTLDKPPWTPPGWLFGPVWTALYVMMGVALYLVWRGGLRTRLQRVAVGLFGLQLALNGLWSFVFFGGQAPGPAFAEILVLDAALAATLVAFFRVSTLAGGLLVPYALWVGFATALNLTIWRLNG